MNISPKRFTLLTALSALWAISAGGAAAADPAPITLVPLPASMTVASRNPPFRLMTGVKIVSSADRDARAAAPFLAEWLRKDTGLNVPVTTVPNPDPTRLIGTIVVTESGADSGLGDEGYELTVTPRNITLRAPHGAGLFYGEETIRQLLQAPGGPRANHWDVPAVTIRDRPRFVERSVMIDSARHYQTMTFLKRTLDLLAYHKMNTLHWHLTDEQGWRLEIKRYPKLTSVGAYRKNNGAIYGSFYTQDQVRDLVAYAAARHITIVPEIEMPAHCIALLAAYPENACFPRAFEVSTSGISPDTPGSPDALCAGREETYAFMENILTEVMDLFPSKAIHIGGDECPTERWKACPVCQAKIKELGLKDERALQNYFTHRIAAFLTQHGRRLQGWNEILDGGDLPKDVIVQPWNRAESAVAAARAGNDVVVSSTRYGYFDYPAVTTPLHRVYEWNPEPAGLTADEQRRILGLEACLWTEGKKDDADADTFLWPRLIAVAEVGWSPATPRSWPEFQTRLVDGDYHRLAAMGLGNPLVTDPDVIYAALIAGSTFQLGEKIGEWQTSRVPVDFADVDWDTTSFMKGPGKYQLRFEYESGAKGIDMAEVNLVRNGSEVVARDVHDGFAGGNSRNQQYTLDLPNFDPESKYTIRVRLRGDGGTDSRGSLYMTHVNALPVQ